MEKTLKNKPRHRDKLSLQMLHQHPCAIFFNLLLVSNLNTSFTQDASGQAVILSPYCPPLKKASPQEEVAQACSAADTLSVSQLHVL